MRISVYNHCSGIAGVGVGGLDSLLLTGCDVTWRFEIKGTLRATP